MHSIDVITLGCSKNLVDSEQLIRLLEAKGYTCTHDAEHPTSDIVVINTCGFIEDAKQESIDEILRFAEAKKRRKVKRLYVMGCLSQRYEKELAREIRQVDKWFGKFNFRELLNELPDLSSENRVSPVRTTPSHYAYIKIAEGCDRHCAYCAIPLITGKHVSRPMDDILNEVRSKVADGAKEFQLIAQELTYYGVDQDGHRHLAELVQRISEIDGVEWIRLHYAYPNQFPMELLDVMRDNPKVCRYLDIALQHTSQSVLDRMRRHVKSEEVIDLLKRIREAVPGIHLRTTLMVGFPGETEADFEELLQFVRDMRFERMGAFAYSEEEGTYSAEHYPDDVSPEVKQHRLERLMALQQDISAEVEAEKVGTVMRVIIDRQEGDWYVGRSEFSSPEVDPEVLVRADEELEIGAFYEVKVYDSEEFDVYAEVI